MCYTPNCYGQIEKEYAEATALIKKVDSVTKEPLSDVQFFVSTSDGGVVGNANGHFTTDSAGTILVADIGGVYGGVWVQAISRWVTIIYGKPIIPTLPQTGY